MLLNRPGELGVIAPGARADLIAVDGDPLADISLLDGQGEHLSHIMKDGVFYKNAVQERRTIVIDDNAAAITGFYEFTGMQEGKPLPRPSRFTMLITRRAGEWRIAHHHSSSRPLPKQ